MLPVRGGILHARPRESLDLSMGMRGCQCSGNVHMLGIQKETEGNHSKILRVRSLERILRLNRPARSEHTAVLGPNLCPRSYTVTE